jgi:hypothetical protein
MAARPLTEPLVLAAIGGLFLSIMNLYLARFHFRTYGSNNVASDNQNSLSLRATSSKSGAAVRLDEVALRQVSLQTLNPTYRWSCCWIAVAMAFS